VTGPQGAIEAAARHGLLAGDGQYLQTTPGQRFAVQFDVGRDAPGLSRTFLLSSQGYYNEWIRKEWLQPKAPPRAFVPGDERLYDALVRWRNTRSTFEAQFDAQRVPVR
jgi:hypothetical protein